MDISILEMLPLKEGLRATTTNLTDLSIVDCRFVVSCGISELAAGLKQNTSLRSLVLGENILVDSEIPPWRLQSCLPEIASWKLSNAGVDTGIIVDLHPTC
jgi:hypothetical protein